MMLFQASSESSHVISFLRAARAGNDQQTVECLDAGVDINVTNSVSRVQFAKRLHEEPKLSVRGSCGLDKIRENRLPERFNWKSKIGVKWFRVRRLELYNLVAFLRQLHPGIDCLCMHLVLVLFRRQFLVGIWKLYEPKNTSLL